MTNRKRNFSPLVWLLVSGGVLVFAGANAHLIYIAYASQPECIDHVKETGTGDGKFMAAMSAC